MMLESVTVTGSCRPQWRTCKVGVEVWAGVWKQKGELRGSHLSTAVNDLQMVECRDCHHRFTE